MHCSKDASKGFGLIARRVVRTDIEFPSSPSGWQDVVPEHSKDVLEWTSALKASLAAPSPKKYVVRVDFLFELPGIENGALQQCI